ncbi:rab-GTPase-TBC domain-containing protein [Gilbertella persicaria]|uniref:rab-GTPase-TBC domain-containing protein n=1 Tax=Gilbertella persicaria TaxID=101096 RepID=UPI0022203271|nr:rab-GTPase-TBC domain-containing protein [Gilbertella persicaria]KAI8059930.1 rab-GTPase-TBC domain-containing protein [Gilbertella persicaria]
MGGGSLDSFQDTSSLSSNQDQTRQQFIHRSIYNPLLHQSSWSTTSVHSVYPDYNPTEFELTPVPLTVPELPPRPDGYGQESDNQVRLIYTKSGFYLREQEKIHGFFTVFSKSMDHVNLCIAWIPEYLIEPHDIPQFVELDGLLASDQDFPSIGLNLGQGETTMMTLKNIYSLYICPPQPDKQGSIVITSKAGDVLKPLWYTANDQQDYELDKASWPGYNIIDILQAFHPLQKSRDMEHVYLVQGTEVPLSPSVASTDIESEPVLQSLRETQWTLLERLSRITQYSREALGHPMISPLLPASLRNNITVQNTVVDYPMASHYLSQWSTDHDYSLVDDTEGLLQGMPELAGPTPIHTRTAPLTPQVWVTLFDHEGKLAVPVDHVRQLIFSGGLENDIRIEAWKFLLGIYPWRSTFDEREAIRRSRTEAYFDIKRTWFDHPEIRNTAHFKDEKHRIDKDVHRTDRSQEAFVGDELPNPDPAMSVGTNANLEVMKDMLISYNYYNTDLGYVQGMSDLLAPLFVAMGDEAMAFWAFAQFMDRVQSNFYQDQSGMHHQLQTLRALIQFMDPVLYQRLEATDTSHLFFCFRWLLVWFKREFEWEDVIRLWEVVWTDHLTDQMVLFVALAVLDTHRNNVLNELDQFDDMLRVSCMTVI